MEIDIIEPGFYYHIYNRGINKETIFSTDEHYLKFMDLCKYYLPLEADVLAYCLMPNHFHFLLYFHSYPDPQRGVKNSSLGNMFNAYAQWFNKKTGRTGGLFQRPFKRIRVSSEEYLKKLVYYIHRNPLHHGFTANPETWNFSSYKAIVSMQPTLINRQQVLDWFDDRENFIAYHKELFEIDGDMLE